MRAIEYAMNVSVQEEEDVSSSSLELVLGDLNTRGDALDELVETALLELEALSDEISAAVRLIATLPVALVCLVLRAGAGVLTFIARLRALVRVIEAVLHFMDARVRRVQTRPVLLVARPGAP